MESSFGLPLRPVIEKGAKEDQLPIRIAQINEQRGSFRNITEQSLQAEINAAKEKGDGEATDEDEDNKPHELDATEHLELLYKRRAEITNAAL
jgi:mediator of RNA polymerase II transcription subunit 17